MSTQGILFELLMAGFFAVACFRARAGVPQGAARAWNWFSFANRYERFRRTRWQWASMLLLLLVVRQQAGLPLLAEMLFPIQLLAFAALPTARQSPEVCAR